MLPFKAKAWKNPRPQLEGTQAGGAAPYSQYGQPLCCTWVFSGVGDWRGQSARLSSSVHLIPKHPHRYTWKTV